MTNAELLLQSLDERLNEPVELTLYERAALHLGFPNPPAEYALSRDVDAVLWIGQAEHLAENGNFWDAIEEVSFGAGQAAGADAAMIHPDKLNGAVLGE